jgi:hypothetical protein
MSQLKDIVEAIIHTYKYKHTYMPKELRQMMAKLLRNCR